MDSTYGRFCKLKSRSVDERRKCDSTIMGSIFLGRQRILSRISSENSLDATFGAMCRIPIYNLTTMQDNESSALSKSEVHHDGCNPTPFLRNCLGMVMSSIAAVLDKNHERGLIKSVNIYGAPITPPVLPADNESDMETDSDATLPLIDENQFST